jgi:hypothetical protein
MILLTPWRDDGGSAPSRLLLRFRCSVDVQILAGSQEQAAADRETEE